VAASLKSIARLPHAGRRFGSLIAVLVLSVSLLMVSKQALRPVPSSSSIDPRLVIHPARTQVQAVLSNGIIVTGFLSPTIPGKNRVRLVIHRGVTGAHRPAAITLTVMMRGMPMAPARATLIRSAHDDYAGTITLPMFGVYRASVVVTTPAGKQRGIMTIKLPLPRV
jgi:hypothetical protein